MKAKVGVIYDSCNNFDSYNVKLCEVSNLWKLYLETAASEDCMACCNQITH